MLFRELMLDANGMITASGHALGNTFHYPYSPHKSQSRFPIAIKNQTAQYASEGTIYGRTMIEGDTFR